MRICVSAAAKSEQGKGGSAVVKRERVNSNGRGVKEGVCGGGGERERDGRGDRERETAGEGRATARDQEMGGGRKRELDLEGGREVGMDQDAGDLTRDLLYCQKRPNIDLRARAQSRGKGTNSQN